MRGSTIYWLGIRHVGVKDSPPQFHELTVSQICKRMIEYLGEVTLAQRIEFVIARTKEEVELRFMERTGNQGRKRVSEDDSIMNELEAMMAELDAETL